MDSNKLKKLESIGYAIQKCCGLCAHADLNGQWGTCQVHEYNHLKHTGPERQMSISVFGLCNLFQISEEALAKLEKYGQFLDAVDASSRL